jgi:hypothetical protein
MSPAANKPRVAFLGLMGAGMAGQADCHFTLYL